MSASDTAVAMPRGSVARLLDRDAAAPSLCDRFWSPRRGALVRYVVRRSRGFAHRSASRFSSDLIEVFCMSQIAVPSLALTAGAMAALNGLLNAMNEGVTRAYRCAALDGRLFSTRALLSYSLAVVAVPYAAILLTTDLTRDAAFLVGLRGLTAAVDACVSALTARTTLVRRPWLSPWVSWTPVGVASVAALASLESGGQAGVLGLAWSMAAARIFVQLSFLRAALRSQRSTSRAPSARPWAKDLLRIAAAMLPFAPGLAVSGAMSHGGGELAPSLVVALLAMPLVFKLVARPFHATELDMRLAILRFAGPGGQGQIPRVARLCCLVALGSFIGAAGLGVLLGAQRELILLLAWVATLATARALLAVGSLFDRDLRWAALSLVVHAFQCVAVPVATPVALVVEVLFVILCLRGFKSRAIAARLELRRQARTPEQIARHGPASFQNALAAGSLAAFIRIDLTRAKRSQRAMRTFLERMRGVLPEGTRLLAIDSSRVIAGWPEGAEPAPSCDAGIATGDERKLSFRLLMAAPLEIARLTALDSSGVRSLLESASGDPASNHAASATARGDRLWRLRSRDGRWVTTRGDSAEGQLVPLLLEAKRAGDCSIFWRGCPRVEDPISGRIYVARRSRGRTTEVAALGDRR